MDRERNYWLAWSQVSGVGSILIDRLLREFGSLSAAWAADEIALQAVAGLGEKSIAKIIADRDRIDPDRLAGEHTMVNPQWWARSDRDYPRLLAEIPSAPSILYYRGCVSAAENSGETPTIAIVGTRSPSDYGRRWAQKISQLLASKGFTIVSGLASGVDGIAHTACLEAGGRTIAVVGTGLDSVYPPQHRSLAENIFERGLMVSEYPAQTPPDRGHFPARNRIIAGLSRVTIVIEAPVKSGALITAHQANDFGRDVLVLPGSIDNAKAIGCLRLLERGAQPILGLDHLLELLAALPQLNAPQQLQLFPTEVNTSSISRSPPDLAPDLLAIWQLIPSEPIDFDAIVARCSVPAPEVSSLLLQLELLGEIVQLPGLRYQQAL